MDMPRAMVPPRIAAHGVLFCDEIIVNVLEYLAPPTEAEVVAYARYGRRPERLRAQKTQSACALACLARTCKALSDRALDVLWRRLDSREPILILFSHAKRKMTWDQVFTRDAMFRADWERIDSYFQRVRELHNARPRNYSRCDPDVWHQLRTHSTPTPLLPRLQRLWSLAVDPSGVVEVFLLSPSLRELSVRLSNDVFPSGPPLFQDTGHPEALEIALGRILSISPHIDHLALKSDLPRDASPQIVPRFSNLQFFQGLRRFSVGGDGDHALAVNQNRLRELRSVKALHHLSAYVILDHDSPPDIGSFPTLRKASLRAHPAHLAQLIPKCAMPRLAELCIDFVADTPPAAFIRAAGIVFEHIPASITALSVTRRQKGLMHAYQLSAASSRLLSPSGALILDSVLKLRSLRKVVLDFAHVSYVDDGHVERMLAAWPALTELRICNSPEKADWTRGRPSGNALVMVATQCPGLVHLELPSTDLTGWRDLTVDESFVGHRLQTLTVATDLDDEEGLRGVALLVDRLFPYLELPDSTELDDDIRVTHWMKVEEHLRSIRESRAP